MQNIVFTYLTMACSETALRLGGREGVAALCRFLWQGAHLTLTEPLGIRRLPDVVVRYPGREHVLDGASDLVGRGDQRWGRPKPAFHAPRECATRPGRAAHRLRRHAEGLGGTVAIVPRAALEHLATGEIILGRAAQAGAQGLRVGPLAPISAKLCEAGLRDTSTDTVDGAEGDTRNTEERRPGVALRGGLTGRRGGATWWRGRPCRRGRWGRGLEAGCEDGKSGFELRIALPAVGGVALAAGQRLLQHTQRLLAPRPWQGQGAFLGLLFAAVVAQGCQGRWGALPGNDGAEDPRPGVSRDIPEGGRLLALHREQGLVHVEDMGSALRDAVGAMA